jgi:hypothetical protein
LIDLENKAIYNQKNLNQIDELYKKLSNEKEKEKIEQIEDPLKIDDELIIRENVGPTTTTSTTTSTTSSTTTSSSSSINDIFIKSG